jgi:hypothetical protein
MTDTPDDDSALTYQEIAAVCGALLGCVIGAFTTFHGLRYLLLIRLALALFVGAAVLRGWVRVEDRDDLSLLNSFDGNHGFVAFTIFVGVAGVMAENLSYVGRLLNFVFTNLPGSYLNWLAVLVLPIGYAGYSFKRVNQSFFGLIEIFVGMTTAFATTFRAELGTAQVLALLGAIYVVARGFTNMSEGNLKLAEKNRVSPEEP